MILLRRRRNGLKKEWKKKDQDKMEETSFILQDERRTEERGRGRGHYIVVEDSRIKRANDEIEVNNEIKSIDYEEGGRRLKDRRIQDGRERIVKEREKFCVSLVLFPSSSPQGCHHSTISGLNDGREEEEGRWEVVGERGEGQGGGRLEGCTCN